MQFVEHAHELGITRAQPSTHPTYDASTGHMRDHAKPPRAERGTAAAIPRKMSSG